MKTTFFVASLIAALMAMPASAQLGPAGVPGAPGLAETDPSVKQLPPAPPPSTQPQAPARKPVPAECSKAKNVEQCVARVDARKKAQEACKDRAGAERKQCVKKKMQSYDCSKTADPARCEQHQKAREICKNTTGQDHKQCLRDNLVPKK